MKNANSRKKSLLKKMNVVNFVKIHFGGKKMDSVKIIDASVSHENDYHGCHERDQKRGFKDIIDSSRFFRGPQIKVYKQVGLGNLMRRLREFQRGAMDGRTNRTME